LAEHLPLFGGFVGVGANVSINKSLATVASGARLGGFEGMTAGIGPVISWRDMTISRAIAVFNP
jgi:hypothetical protein